MPEWYSLVGLLERNESEGRVVDHSFLRNHSLQLLPLSDRRFSTEGIRLTAVYLIQQQLLSRQKYRQHLGA